MNTTQKITITLIAGLIILPNLSFADREGRYSKHREEFQGRKHAYRAERKEENKAFRDSLKNLSPEERAKAMLEHRKDNYSKNTAFHEQLHSERKAQLEKVLSENSKLTQEQKDELLKFMETQYQENTAFRNDRHAKNIAAFEKIINDQNLTQEQRKAAIKEQCANQKLESKSFWQSQRAERKAFHESLKPAAQTSTQPA